MRNDTSRIYIVPMNLYNNQLFVVRSTQQIIFNCVSKYRLIL